jgi:hypothetical protein
MDALVVIKSCYKYADRRQAQRDTWLPDLKGWADYVFIVGHDAEIVESDVLFLPCDDGFRNIAPKVQLACRYALSQMYRYVFICDDDTYVRPERLRLTNFRLHDYLGYLRVPPLSYNEEIPYAQGSAYWLSSRAAGFVADSPFMKPNVIDDGAVGQALYENVDFVHENNFEPGPEWQRHYPRKDNHLVSTHKCLPDDMRKMHKLWMKEHEL